MQPIGATDRTAAEMNEMPVVRVSVLIRLTHRQDEHPIGELQISNRERIKQASHGQWSHVTHSSSICHSPARSSVVRRRVTCSRSDEPAVVGQPFLVHLSLRRAGLSGRSLDEDGEGPRGQRSTTRRSATQACRAGSTFVRSLRPTLLPPITAGAW